MAEFKKFNSNEECAKALYQYMITHGHITAKEPFVVEDNILHDINNLRGSEWLELLPRNAETEAFFAYLDPEYIPHFYGDGAILEDSFFFDNSITPGEYWELATGESGVVISSLDALRSMMDEAGLGDVWDYAASDVNEAVANNEHVVFVDDGNTISYPNNDCRIFQVTDEMYERYQKLYEKTSDISEVDETKTEVMGMFNSLQKMTWGPSYWIASDMVYLLRTAEANGIENLSVDDAYLLATKLNDANGAIFASPISRSEYAYAVGDLIENGVTKFNNSHFDALNAEDTLKLLLSADIDVFGALVESTAVQNCYRFLPDEFQLDETEVAAVERAIEGLSDGVDNLIAFGTERSKATETEKDLDREADTSKEASIDFDKE